MIKLFVAILVCFGFGLSQAETRPIPLIPEGEYIESRSVQHDRPTITYTVECTSVKCFYSVSTMFNGQKATLPTYVKPLEPDVVEQIMESIKRSFELDSDQRSDKLKSELLARPNVGACYRFGAVVRDIGYFCVDSDANGVSLLFFRKTTREGFCWSDMCFDGKLVRKKNE
jgi:hypothetical protein